MRHPRIGQQRDVGERDCIAHQKRRCRELLLHARQRGMTALHLVRIEISGGFSGELGVVINKRDFDVVLELQQLMPDGIAMPLSYYLGRASYTEDMSVRRLLTPGEPTRIVFERTRIVSRRVEAGSRLVVVLDVVKDGFHQINYGTGGDVSDESIADADEPLRIAWSTDSFIRLPITRSW